MLIANTSGPFGYVPLPPSVVLVSSFKLDKSIQYENSPIVNAYYNHEYTKILASTANGSLVVFPIEAESNILEDDED